ncbi:hypothetical protein Tco_0927056 [Tanacetum coccineum]|uniref:Uncharacterized protein n=1 Tax=Tanacetum coccineum TaxID=301880 RepID=A0ABQ5DCN9_9ASTR
MTGNKAYLAEYQDFNGGHVAFGGSKGYITGKGKIKTGKLDFKDVCFVKELQHFNLFSVSQMYDKKNKVLFTDTECLVLSPEFKLPDENQVLLRIPRQNNMYNFNLVNIVLLESFMRLLAFLHKAPFNMLSLYITSKVAGKPVSISKASIRSDLLFDDADGIDSLPNQAIFDAIQLMGITLERQSKPQPIPSLPHLSEDQHETQIDPSPRPSLTTHIPDSIPEGSGGNRGDQAKEIKHLKVQIKKLKKKAKPGRKPAKAEPTVHKDPAFNELDNDTMDYMETEDAQDMGRTSYVVHEEKESAEKGVSTEDPLSTAQPKVSIDKSEDSTDKPDEGTDKPKEKGVELKDVEETKRPRPTSTRSLLTLKPLPKIDPKDKGKKMIEEEDESDTDSEDITEAEKKFKQLARDEEVARKVQEDWEAEEEVKKLAEEEATKVALSNEYDFIQARLNADKILALKTSIE